MVIGVKDVLKKGVLDGKKVRKLLLQLGCVKLVVASGSNNHLSLLLQSEVLPAEARIHVFLVHLENLVVAYHPGVREIPDPSQIPLRHLQRDREELVEYGHGVGNVDNLVVSSDLRDEVAGIRQVRGNGHSDTQRADVLVVLKQILHLWHDIIT